MVCPICNLTVAPQDPDSTKIGNTEIHNGCLSRKRKEAESKGMTLHFIWQGEHCKEVRLVFETNAQGR